MASGQIQCWGFIGCLQKGLISVLSDPCENHRVTFCEPGSSRYPHACLINTSQRAETSGQREWWPVKFDGDIIRRHRGEHPSLGPRFLFGHLWADQISQLLAFPPCFPQSPVTHERLCVSFNLSSRLTTLPWRDPERRRLPCRFRRCGCSGSPHRSARRSCRARTAGRQWS